MQCSDVHMLMLQSLRFSGLPQAILPLRSDWSIRQCGPDFAVIALLLYFFGDAHAGFFFFEKNGETWILLAGEKFM